MNLKNILFFIIFYTNFCVLRGQTDWRRENERIKNLPFSQRLTFNVGGGIGFSNFYTSINIQPQVGYRVNARFTVGVGMNFQYVKYNGLTSRVYGGNLFARYQLTNNLFAQVQYERLNYTYLNRQAWNDYILLGGGYSAGRGLFISAYYVLLAPANNNIYGSNPFLIRIGFFF